MSSAARGEEVQVTVVAILANDRDNKVDPKLTCVAREVQKQEPHLTGFQLGKMTCRSLQVGEKAEFELVDNLVAAVTVIHGADKRDRVCLKVRPPRVGDITYSIVCGKYFPIVTRYQTKDKDRLIIAVMVAPCQEKPCKGRMTKD